MYVCSLPSGVKDDCFSRANGRGGKLGGRQGGRRTNGGHLGGTDASCLQSVELSAGLVERVMVVVAKGLQNHGVVVQVVDEGPVDVHSNLELGRNIACV